MGEEEGVEVEEKVEEVEEEEEEKMGGGGGKVPSVLHWKGLKASLETH